MTYAIEWQRALSRARGLAETGRVIAHKINRGFTLLGWCFLAWIGGAFGFGAAMQARESDAVLLRIAKHIHAVNPASAAQARDLFLLVLVAGVAVLVWTMIQIVAWFRHTEKRN